jgi:hypothetical protein
MSKTQHRPGPVSTRYATADEAWQAWQEADGDTLAAEVLGADTTLATARATLKAKGPAFLALVLALNLSGVTQGAIGKRIGVTQPTVSRYVNMAKIAQTHPTWEWERVAQTVRQDNERAKAAKMAAREAKTAEPTPEPTPEPTEATEASTEPQHVPAGVVPSAREGAAVDVLATLAECVHAVDVVTREIGKRDPLTLAALEAQTLATLAERIAALVTLADGARVRGSKRATA